jgi:3-hydroxybutyryl-CoA dehydratase
MELSAGDVFTYERTFTEDAVRAFAAVTYDEGDHHLEPDEQGRLVVHGLLTASLATKIGGDGNVLARTMTFEFRRPVYTGNTVRCDVEYTRVEGDDRLEVEADVTCTRLDDDSVVLTGSYEGVILAT